MISNKPLPDGWCEAQLTQVVDVNPAQPSDEPGDDTVVSFVPMASVEALTGRLDPNNHRSWHEVKKGYTRFQDRDVLFAKITPCMENGKAALARGLSAGVGAGSTEFHVLRPGPAALPELLIHYVLQEEFRKSARAQMTGTAGQLRVPSRFLHEQTIPVPPIAEQRQIVDAIESHFTRLDDAEATLERVQRNLKRYRASVLKAAVEGRLVPTENELARTKSRDYEHASILLERILAERRCLWEEIELEKMKARGKLPIDEKWKAKYAEPAAPAVDSLPELPEGWCWSTVAQLASVGTGATPKRGDSRFWSNGDVPWVTSAVVNEEAVRDPTDYVTSAALAETNLSLYPPGTLLIALYGEGKTRGRTTVLAIEATTNQALAALELSGTSRQIRKWLLNFLEHNYLELRRSAAGGVQPNLNLGIVRSICVPLPPLAEQDRIVAEVDRVLSIAAATYDAVASNRSKAARLRQSILKWAFEGRLVDQDPTDEPASELLERIRAEREVKPAQPSRARGRTRATTKGRP